MTTCQKEMIDGANGGLPITYAKRSGVKAPIVYDDLHLADIASFNSKIGFITNCSTSLYALLKNYSVGSKEYDEIYQRLKVCRYLQGAAIDKAKLGTKDTFPEHWTKFNHIKDDVTGEDREKQKFNNSIVIDKRPYFMRYLYPHYNKKHMKHKEIYDTIAIAKFGITIDMLMAKKNKSIEEKAVVETYDRRGFFINTDCVMNKICWHMEKSVKENRIKLYKSNHPVYNILLDEDVVVEEDKLQQMRLLFEEYRRAKQNRSGDDSIVLSQYAEYIKSNAINITSNGAELANMAVVVCYVENPSANKDFVWRVFGEEIAETVKKNRQSKITVPVIDDNGDVEFLNKKYKFVEIAVD